MSYFPNSEIPFSEIQKIAAVFVRRVKKSGNSFVVTYKCVTFAPEIKNIKVDSLAQLVEHNTFNVGVLGSNPKRITKKNQAIV